MDVGVLTDYPIQILCSTVMVILLYIYNVKIISSSRLIEMVSTHNQEGPNGGSAKLFNSCICMQKLKKKKEKAMQALLF